MLIVPFRSFVRIHVFVCVCVIELVYHTLCSSEKGKSKQKPIFMKVKVFDLFCLETRKNSHRKQHQIIYAFKEKDRSIFLDFFCARTPVLIHGTMHKRYLHFYTIILMSSYIICQLKDDRQCQLLYAGISNQINWISDDLSLFFFLVYFVCSLLQLKITLYYMYIYVQFRTNFFLFWPNQCGING